MSKMTRRSFLNRLYQGALAMLAWASGARLAGQPAPSKLVDGPPQSLPMADPEESQGDAAAIAQRIREAFPYLKIDPDGLAAFAADFVRHRDAGDLMPSMSSPGQRFLLSSTFFDNDADESKVVEYVTFFDPILNPCSNRLARSLDEPLPQL